MVLVNDEPITGYEVEQRIKLSLLGAADLQKRLQAKLKSPNINDKFKAFAIKRLKANPPKTEDEQQARVKQLQAEFVQSLKSEVEADFRPVARKNALDELIEERLKLQEAKRMAYLQWNYFSGINHPTVTGAIVVDANGNVVLRLGNAR